MTNGLSDTIAAVATPPGRGGVGVLRLSGPRALAVADAVFSGKSRPSQTRGGRFLFGKIYHGAEVIDEGLCLVFRGPHSYTGEDVAELQTHGSPAVLQAVLQAALAAGARVAKAGEFTLRAYINGRLDLTQAEAVLNIIHSDTSAARRQAVLGLGGALGERISVIESRLVGALAAVVAMLDYPEEGVPEADFVRPLEAAAAELRALLATEHAGKMTRQGARVALIGAPNAGKSSLLNRLLGYERSIVSPQAGTTRDYLEANLSLAGVPITLIDTAGLRETADAIEAAGVSQATSLAEAADVVLVVEDGSHPREVISVAAEGPKIFVQSKSDLGQVWSSDEHLTVSAATGEGIDELRRRIEALLLGEVSRGEAWLGSERQAEAARLALACVEAALGLPDDFAATEIEAALGHLAAITGADVQDSVVDTVFRNFCVGK